MSQENVKAAMMKLIEGIQANPASSQVFFKADTEWVEDVRCTAQVRDFPVITIDEPPVLGGQDAGVNPVELVLVALGTCQEIMYSAYASVMDIPLDSVKVSVKGDLDLKGLFGLDESVPAGYTQVTFQTTIESSADDATLVKLVETAESHCPVLDIFTRAVPVNGSVTINGKDMNSI
ncbi:MAG: osmotically inducible protein OsmC [Methylophaga sp.]|nr:MAG: osmotically inducible protein OsmC [Methylophaga sp.]